MNIYSLVETYGSLIKGNHTNSLDVIQAAEDQGVKEMVDCLAEKGFTKEKIVDLCNGKSKGRKPEVIDNPMAKTILDNFGVDNNFMAEFDDAVTGACNSFETESRTKRARLSKRKLSLVMRMPTITTQKVKDVLFIGDAQARRYIKAAKVLIAITGNK